LARAGFHLRRVLRNHLTCRGFLIGMRVGRAQRAGFALAALCAALSAWAAAGALGSPPAPEAGAAPLARAAAKCDAQCQADRRREQRRELRRRNARQKRPNVIVIATDDQNLTDMFVMRHTLALLGARGTTFRNSYVSYPLCCPSRATFLTGQYAHNHGVVTDQQYSSFDNTNTLAVWLRHAKYRTAMVGKYLNGYGVLNRREIPPGWTQWFALTGGTEQKRYAYNLNENGKVRYYPRKQANYVDYVLGSKVNGLLKEWTPSPKPFFLYFNPSNPHGERALPFWSTRDPEPAPQYLGALGDLTAPKTPNFNEPDMSDKPEQIRDIPKLSDDQLADLDRRYRGRLESLLSVDDEVRRIVGLVRKYGDKRKTFLIFTSDNGLQLGAHRVQFKNFLYEEGERVPLIIRGPGIPQGVTREQLVANIDLAPTIAAIANAVPGRVMDGISLLPLTRDATFAQGRDILFESTDLDIYGLRRGQWSYNRYSNGEAELYNLETDPYQVENLLYDPPGPQQPSAETEALANQLAARLAQLRTCAGASCN
jgi:N-acetylglucosamine-6-sulfatase